MEESVVGILIVEDDPGHAELIRRAFEQRAQTYCLTLAESLAEARACMRSKLPGLIIADWRLPDGDGLELLTNLDGFRPVPVIIMTSYGNERMAVEAMRAGALDYIVKSPEVLWDLPHFIDRSLQHWSNIAEQERMRAALENSEAGFRLLAENSTDIIMRLDPGGNFLYISPAIIQILGYKPEGLLGQSIAHLFPAQEQEQLAGLYRDGLGDQRAFTCRACRKDGAHVWLETSYRMIRDPFSGAVVEIHGSARDVTERILAKTRLQEALNELETAYDAAIEGWVRALDLRDHETEGHTQRVIDLTVQMARAIGIPDEQIVHIRRGAYLHDIGKIGITDKILKKEGPLDEVEMAEIRKHPLYARDMLDSVLYLRPAMDIPIYHHEKWDGSGYPYGLQKEQIPLAARMFAIIDVSDALSYERVYRKSKWPRDQVIRYLGEQSGIHFDPHLVDIFIQLVRHQ